MESSLTEDRESHELNPERSCPCARTFLNSLTIFLNALKKALMHSSSLLRTYSRGLPAHKTEVKVTVEVVFTSDCCISEMLN